MTYEDIYNKISILVSEHVGAGFTYDPQTKISIKDKLREYVSELKLNINCSEEYYIFLACLSINPKFTVLCTLKIINTDMEDSKHLININTKISKLTNCQAFNEKIKYDHKNFNTSLLSFFICKYTNKCYESIKRNEVSPDYYNCKKILKLMIYLIEDSPSKD